MRKKVWLTISVSFVGLIALSAELSFGRSPVKGSNIQFLNAEAVENSYAFCPMQHGGLVRGQIIDLYGEKFEDVNNRIAAAAKTLPGYTPAAYRPIECKYNKVMRGFHYYKPGSDLFTIEVTEKKLGSRTYVEVTEYQALNQVDNIVTKIAYAGRSFEKMRYLKRDEAMLVAGDPQKEFQM